jgi:hypothetical protein
LSSAAAADEAPDVITRRIDGPIITGGTDEENIRQATREWEQGAGGHDPFIEQRNEVIERRYDGREHGTKTLQEATRDISNAHFDEHADTRLAAQIGKTTPSVMREVIKNPDEVRNLRPDWSEAEIHHYTRTGEEPAHKMGLVDHKGALVEPLRDGAGGVRPDQALNPREATEQLRAFREADAAYRSQLAEQLHAAATAQTQPEPVEPPPPTPRQSDDAALAQQKAQLDAQQHWVQQTAAIQQLSADERSCQHELWQISQFLNPSYTPSELRSGQAVGEERQAWLTEAVQRAAGLQRVAANAAEVRTVKQASLTLARQAQVEQWSATQDAAFAKHVQEHRPEFASEAGQVRMQKATLGYLQRTTGLSEQEIKQRWRAGQWRSTPEQIVLVDAVSHDLAKQSMRDLNSKRAYTPPVTPGAARPRGADAEQSIQELERKMANASSVQQQLKWSTKLTQARRNAGLL